MEEIYNYVDAKNSRIQEQRKWNSTTTISCG